MCLINKKFRRSFNGRSLFFLILTLPAWIFGQEQHSAWKVFSLGSPAMAISMPGLASPLEVSIQPSLINSLRSYYAYHYQDRPYGMEVQLYYIEYSDEKYTQKDSREEQNIQDLTAKGGQDIKYKTSDVNTNKKKGIRWSGTQKLKDIKQEFSITVFVDGSKIWKIITFNKAGDKAKREIINKILGSISFN